MSPATWIIVGATRGIGLEFVRQLLRQGERVIATVRSTSKASQLWTLTAGAAAPGVGSWCRLLECDVTVDESINIFVEDVAAMRDVHQIDYVVLNAGIFKYPNLTNGIDYVQLV
ncbi:hypothetical protein MMC31_002579 [Peltigera leucophlebia]|nr:hypothetical protein [Peltigera leucophlebia]